MNYKEITQYIERCYLDQKFNDQFYFYKLRKEKNPNRAGIFTEKNDKYFFKIIDNDEYNDEDEIKFKIDGKFKIVDKYYELKNNDKIINLYKYFDTINGNSFNYLRSKKYTLEEKTVKINKFFSNLNKLYLETTFVEENKNNRKSDRFFMERFSGKRFQSFYGENAEKLLNDIKEICPGLEIKYDNYLKKLKNYFNNNHKTVFVYTHGDFHDFNFSLDGTFWDTDTFDYNPILNDFAIYYWHFYAREDYLIYKYSPWLVETMHNELSNYELNEIRKLKQNIILKQYKFIKKLFEKFNIENELKKEFIFKLFCRAFLIDNVVTAYSKEDRKKVYDKFSEFLSNEDLEKILFRKQGLD